MATLDCWSTRAPTSVKVRAVVPLLRLVRAPGVVGRPSGTGG